MQQPFNLYPRYDCLNSNFFQNFFIVIFYVYLPLVPMLLRDQGIFSCNQNQFVLYNKRKFVRFLYSKTLTLQTFSFVSRGKLEKNKRLSCQFLMFRQTFLVFNYFYVGNICIKRCFSQLLTYLLIKNLRELLNLIKFRRKKLFAKF